MTAMDNSGKGWCEICALNNGQHWESCQIWGNQPNQLLLDRDSAMRLDPLGHRRMGTVLAMKHLAHVAIVEWGQYWL